MKKEIHMRQPNKDLRKMFDEILKHFSFEKYYTRTLGNKEFAEQLLFRLAIYKFFTKKWMNLYSEISDVDFKKLLSKFLIEHPIERESKRLEVMEAFLKDNFSKCKNLDFSNISDFSDKTDISNFSNISDEEIEKLWGIEDGMIVPDDEIVVPDDEATVLKSLEVIFNYYVRVLKSPPVIKINTEDDMIWADDDFLILGINKYRPLGLVMQEIQKIIESKRTTQRSLFKNNGEISDADIKRLRESYILQYFDLWFLEQAYHQKLTDENIAQLFFRIKDESETKKDAENIRKTTKKNFKNVVDRGYDYLLMRYIHRQKKS